MNSEKTQTSRQLSGFPLSPLLIEQPELARPYLEQTARMGHFATILFIRHMHRNVLDRRVHDAVSEVVRMGHELGLKVVLDTDHYCWGGEFVETHPEAALWAIIPVEAFVQDGRFEFCVNFPGMAGLTLFEEISAVFCPDGSNYRGLPPQDMQVDWMHIFAPKCGLRLKGWIPDSVSGNLVFYVAVKSLGLADVAHPEYLKAQEAMLDAYADIPLDGFGWDEPGKGMEELTCYKAGAGFLGFFQQINGYDLRSQLIYLDHLDGTPKSVQVRHDYYRTLVEMNLIAQRRHNDYAKELFGPNLILGTHHTWSGYSPDLAGGVIDYFKLGQVLTAAWTDGGWSLEVKYSLHNFMLAEGLKKELGFRDAYYNDWGLQFPEVEDMRLANRLKMLFHVNWFNSCGNEGDASGSMGVENAPDKLLGFARVPEKSMAQQDVTNLNRFDQMVGDDFYAHTDVALLYNWQTLAVYPKWLIRAFYTGFTNMSLHLVDQGLYAAIMSGDGLLKAQIGKGSFTVNDLTYRVLVLPYAGAMAEAVYQKVMAICEAGVPVIAVGPPPEFLLETGRNIGEDFAGRVGIKPVSFQEYANVFAQQAGLPAINAWEPSWLDVCYPLVGTGAKMVCDIEGHLSYVKAADRPLYYMPAPDPREDLVNLVASLVHSPAQVFAEDCYYRFFLPKQGGGTRVVVAVAKGHAASFAMAPDSYGAALRPPVKRRALKALFRFQEGELVLEGGTWAAVRLDGERVVEFIGDCPEVCWNGNKVEL